MTSETTTAAAADVIKKALAADFDKVNIVDVKFGDRTEDDGGWRVYVFVIFEGQATDLDARKVSGAVRHIRPKLAEIGETAFPLITFVPKREAGKLEPA